MSRPEKISASTVRAWLPRRSRDSHKGDYGHVLVVAGSRGMSGAAALCAWGALRGGAGLVTAAVPESQQPIVARKVRPEAMTLALPETDAGSLSTRAVPEMLSWMARRRVSSLAIGPGLSRKPETASAVRRLLAGAGRSPDRLLGAVLDADGFLALKPSRKADPLRSLRIPAVVTPHPGELAAFLGISVPAVQRHRLKSAREFARLYGVVCVLKGHSTIVSDGRRTFVNPTGNPGMATGGSGDVLTGLIAALLAQVKGGALEAAAAGVFLHGLAGDLAARRKTEIGLLAGDLAEALPEAFKTVLK